MVINPYLWNGMWVFDDTDTSLVREPFVMGIDTMLTEMVSTIPNAEEGFNLIFSANPFPGHMINLERMYEEDDGNWYKTEDLETKEGWLCPALFKYFDVAPENIYVQIKERA